MLWATTEDGMRPKEHHKNSKQDGTSSCITISTMPVLETAVIRPQGASYEIIQYEEKAAGVSVFFHVVYYRNGHQ